MKILHITTHMGGGAGNAISNIILQDQEDEHSLICLQRSEKRQFIDRCVEKGIHVVEEPRRTVIEDGIEWADAAILHWWHHPLMCGFLAVFPDIPCRLVLWSHISGCSYPILRKAFIDLFDRVFLTTPYSYDNPEWKRAEREEIREKSDIVYGLGDLEIWKTEQLPRQRGDQFVVGYVGTLGKAKLNERFTEFCMEVIDRIPNVRFLMVGELAGGEWLLEEIGQKRLEEYFEFTGYCEDVKSRLAEMDVFGYPLGRQHFGTTENVILEAMAAGLPVVVLNQNTEKYIVTHQETGMLVQDKQEYAKAVQKLYRNPELRQRMGEKARESVFERYDIRRNVKAFREGLAHTVRREKHLAGFEALWGRLPHEWFLSGLAPGEERWFRSSLEGGQNGKAAEAYIRACQPILRVRSKSSVLQFAQYYPDDKALQFWRNIIEEEERE